MAVVRSAGRLVGLERRGAWPPGTATGFWPTSKEPLAFSEGLGPELVAPSTWYGPNASYATLYRTQPAIRTVVDACARNIAQLGLHTYERVSDTDRQRDTTSALAQLVTYPNPATTQYRLIEHTLIDFFVYGNAYLVKLRDGEDEPPFELWRVPAERVTAVGVLYPEAYWISSLEGTWYEVPPRDVIHFREAHPGVDTVHGLSKIETLRRKLLEEILAQGYRTQYWRQGARPSGVIERPLEAPEWDKTTREYFRQEFNEVYGGGRGAGLVPVLDEGMTWKDAGSHSAEEQQLAEARELHDEEVARAYHMPLPVVGLLRRATFSNVKEQHKMLYQDALGPSIQMVEQELETRLVPEFAERGTHYLEFNVNEKLRGSFEEQAQTFQTAVGRPWMTVNEARARQNLPRDPDPASDRIAAPLNMATGETTLDAADVADEASL
jgi:HK97 family phage portal protein